MRSTLRLSLFGLKFGRLEVVGLIPKESGDKARYWKCLCSCGNQAKVATAKLTTGHTQSCGCLQRDTAAEIKTKHGLKKVNPVEYGIWMAMRRRCNNSNAAEFHNYGARGISVCAEWDDFGTFISDMGMRPSASHSIERRDNSRGYDPHNCVWATMIEQANNTRRNRFITIGGITKTLSQWSREFGISSKTVSTRICRGMSDVDAVVTPLRKSQCSGL